MFSANFPGKCVTLHCRKEIARTFETSTFVIFYLINQLYCPKKLCYYPKKPCSTNPLPNCNLTADLYPPRLEMVPYRPTAWNPIWTRLHPLVSWNVCFNVFVPSFGRRSAALQRTRIPRPRNSQPPNPHAWHGPIECPATVLPPNLTARKIIGQKRVLHRHGSDKTCPKVHPHPPGRKGASSRRKVHRRGREIEKCFKKHVKWNNWDNSFGFFRNNL